MGLLASLGIDLSAFVHFLIFAGSFCALHFIAIKPYFYYFSQRENLLNSHEVNAVEQQVANLKAEFSEKALDLNNKIDAIYKEKEQEGQESVDAFLEMKKRELSLQINQWYEDLEKAKTSVRQEIQSDFGKLKETFVHKLMHN